VLNREEKREREKKRIRKRMVIFKVNMIKEHYMHAQELHDEMSHYVQFNT
jgi:hypothetical protein